MKENFEGKLTEGSVAARLVAFSLPFLMANFLQTLYGMADLFIAGQFNGADVITAVSIGSQIMHMITVIIAGLAMGTTATTLKAILGLIQTDEGSVKVFGKDAFNLTSEEKQQLGVALSDSS
ncbi:MAG: hypothetical protein IIT45_04440, partial [Treponema sp.]|nr:hypothetical protein [Treponema sp.]